MHGLRPPRILCNADMPATGTLRDHKVQLLYPKLQEVENVGSNKMGMM